MTDPDASTERRRSGESRSETMDRVAVRARRELDDTRLDRFRPLGRRRAAIVVWAVIVAVSCGLALVAEPLVDLVALVIGGGATWGLRRLVRTVADLPDEVLDERMVARRNADYRIAYQIIVAAFLTVSMGLYLAVDASRIDYVVEPGHLNALFLFTLLGGLGLPSAVYGWREPEV